MSLNPDIIEKSKVYHVFYDIGRFEGDKRNKKLVKAPFDLIKHEDGTLFLSPVGTEPPSGLWAEDGRNERTQLARGDFGYVMAEFVVIGEHELGDYQGQPETWKGVHRFGMV